MLTCESFGENRLQCGRPELPPLGAGAGGAFGHLNFPAPGLVLLVGHGFLAATNVPPGLNELVVQVSAHVRVFQPCSRHASLQACPFEARCLRGRGSLRESRALS